MGKYYVCLIDMWGVSIATNLVLGFLVLAALKKKKNYFKLANTKIPITDNLQGLKVIWFYVSCAICTGCRHRCTHTTPHTT